MRRKLNTIFIVFIVLVMIASFVMFVLSVVKPPKDSDSDRKSFVVNQYESHRLSYFVGESSRYIVESATSIQSYDYNCDISFETSGYVLLRGFDYVDKEHVKMRVASISVKPIEEPSKPDPSTDLKMTTVSDFAYVGIGYGINIEPSDAVVDLLADGGRIKSLSDGTRYLIATRTGVITITARRNEDVAVLKLNVLSHGDATAAVGSWILSEGCVIGDMNQREFVESVAENAIAKRFLPKGTYSFTVVAGNVNLSTEDDESYALTGKVTVDVSDTATTVVVGEKAKTFSTRLVAISMSGIGRISDFRSSSYQERQ